VDPTDAPHFPGARALSIVAFPNPSRGSVSFAVRGLDESSRLRVFDASGRLVRVVSVAVTGRSGAATWDGRDATGRMVSAGTYVTRLEAGTEHGLARVTLLR
jgi:hypothetical protein